MGGSSSKEGEELTLDELEIYRACTCLDVNELVTLLIKYRAIGGSRKEKRKAEENLPHLVGQKTAQNLRSSMNQPRKTTMVRHGEIIVHGDGASEVEMQKIIAQPEFRYNPLAKRLCITFSSDGTGNLNFDEFVDLYHVLSPKASQQLKVEVAFRVFDFDDDGHISDDDLYKLVQALTSRAKGGGNVGPSAMVVRSDADEADEAGAKKELLTDDNIRAIVNSVMDTCDLDGRGQLSFHEFKGVMDKLGDNFATNFCVPIEY